MGNALWFDGSDDYVSIPQNPAIITGRQLTVSGWLYLDGSASSTFQTLMSDMTNCDWTYPGFWTGFDPTYAPGVAAMWADFCGDFKYPTFNTNIAYRWVHYAYAHDGTNGRVYLDGHQLASETGSFTNAHRSELLIGWAHDPDYTYYWKGRLDDVRLYTSALSSVTISNLYDGFQDADGDGLDNLSEYQSGTSPLNTDSDGDGLPDGIDADPDVFDTNAPTFTITYPTNGMVIP